METLVWLAVGLAVSGVGLMVLWASTRGVEPQGRPDGAGIPDVEGIEPPPEAESARVITRSKGEPVGDSTLEARKAGRQGIDVLVLMCVLCSIAALVLAFLVILDKGYSADDKKAAWAVFSSVLTFWFGVGIGSRV